ncbi:AMP binding protein [Cantharellus anzutake]|uniref:AMP binding protein n=1 Tax=Cantharellus anzutake TaxID=1750568 RepID=UPI001907EBE2|nr:AMP binding protein [Cantharellus anzutake]KAF8338789.1 AMP binding protein [Cantharellus anzutake]
MTIYRSKRPDFDYAPSTSIFTFLKRNESPSDAKRVAFIDAVTDERITRGQVFDFALRVGYGVKQIGGKRGDVAMILCPNSIAWPYTFLGLQAAGLRPTLANVAYTPPELTHQLKDSRAHLIFVHPLLFPTVINTLNGLGLKEGEIKKRVIIMSHTSQDEKDEKTVGIPASWRRLKELRNGGKLAKEEEFNGSQVHETALLCYSSGTTGLSKGVETTHENITSVIQISKPVFPPISSDKDVGLAVLPFFHILISLVVLFFFDFKVPNVVMAKFEPVLFCASVEKYKVTTSAIVPPILLGLTLHPAANKYDLRTIKTLFSGAAPLSAGLVKRVKQKFISRGNHDAVITQGYGLTETSPTAIWFLRLLLPNLEVRLVDDDEKDVPPGPDSRGELWIRGKIIMKGYLNNARATKECITPDGWFKTGDIAIIDNEGFYYIVDRKKELIKYKGFQVPPADLEAVLLTHPDVADAGVIGIYSQKDETELPRAYISPKNAALADPKNRDQCKAFERAVQDWIKSKVAHHKQLRGGVIVIAAIPKSPTGKILRRELRELAKQEAKATSATAKL